MTMRASFSLTRSGTVAQELQDGRSPVCVQCGQSLRGMDYERCPECGAEVRERAEHPHETPASGGSRLQGTDWTIQ